MTRPAAALLALLMAGCGYVGEPMPPALKIPLAVQDLQVLQRGANLVIDFTAPERTTDGFTLSGYGGVDLRAGVSPTPQFDPDRWSEAATPIPVNASAPGPVHIETPAAPWVGREIVVGVRVANTRGRYAGWSNLVALTVVPPPERPEALSVEAVPTGVRLRWTAADRAGQAFRVWRRAGAEEKSSAVARVEAREWTDTATEYGTAYEYAVQSVVKAADKEAESELSRAASIVPRDIFPPATPKEVTAIAGAESVELGWERNVEDDFAGYRVYRSTNGGAFERVADMLEAPSYSDRAIQAGARYSYALSAVDRNGNESPRSEPVAVETRQ